MAISKLQSDLQKTVIPMLEQHDEVYVALGCGRAYVGAVPSELCKRCGGVHENMKIKSPADLEGIDDISTK
jgi:hypothetical protein